jgi:hypothetical protein
MKGDTIKYQAGYKYVLWEDYSVRLRILPSPPVLTTKAVLLSNGMLTIFKGYPWNGANVAPDNPDIIRGSLVHDCLYEMMRAGRLSLDYRCQADDILKEICLEDGMSPAYAAIVHEAVSAFGEGCALPKGEPPILIAPRPWSQVTAPKVGE